MSDRVAEALAALEAAEKKAGEGPWESRPGGLPAVTAWFNPTGETLMVASTSMRADAEFIAKFRNAAPALLKIASDYHHLEWDSRLLDELADAVLGPAPTPEEHRAP